MAHLSLTTESVFILIFFSETQLDERSLHDRHTINTGSVSPPLSVSLFLLLLLCALRGGDIYYYEYNLY